MTRALLKKQLLEVFSWLYSNKKTGKRRSRKGIIGYAALYFVLFALLGVCFWFIGDLLCEPLISVDLGWFYWCIMALIATFLGVFGSVFNTYSSLYQAKDNDLLLSMPIPVSRILTARLSGVYAMGLMYELIVMIPAQIVWLYTAPLSVLGVVNVVLLPLLLSGLVLVLSAVLGWVVALISAKLKNKSVLTVITSLIFFAGYYYLSAQTGTILQAFIENAEALSGKMQMLFYPLYHMGSAAEGKPLSMLFFTGFIALLLCLTYLILSRSFLKLATANAGSVKKAYKDNMVKPHTISKALLLKEWMRFSGNSTYMLNCGLGIILMPIMAIVLFWKADVLLPLLTSEFVKPYVPLIALVAPLLTLSTTYITAPSVSLEGKSLWLLQSLPVRGKQILQAKLRLQLLLAMPSAAILVLAEEILLRPEPLYALLIPVNTALFAVLTALLGLILGLKMSNFQWTSEIVPIKQGASVGLTLFGGWLIVVALGVLYYLLRNTLSMSTYFLIITVLFAVSCTILLHWLLTKGARLFETL